MDKEYSNVDKLAAMEWPNDRTKIYFHYCHWLESSPMEVGVWKDSPEYAGIGYLGDNKLKKWFEWKVNRISEDRLIEEAKMERAVVDKFIEIKATFMELQKSSKKSVKSLSALVLKNTGKEYKTVLGDFSSARGDLRLLNVTAGFGGKSYMNYSKVPAKLLEFCTRLNKERENYAAKSMTQLYEIGFDAHYDLLTIHPWADGNGRMARLLMNMLQFEFGLIPTKILKENKEEYIKALVETRENEDLNVFREFMTATMIKNLTRDIEVYRKSIDDTSISGEKPQKSREKRMKSREKIMTLLSQDNTLSAAALAERIGITAKAVEKQIAKMKADGVLRRIGPDKGGYWQVVEKTD